MKYLRARFAAMSNPAPERCFPNNLPDYNQLHDSETPTTSVSSSTARDSVSSLLKTPHSTLSQKFLSRAVSLKDQVVKATWSESKSKLKDLSVYTGILGTAFLCFRSYQATGNLEDIHVCRDIIRACSEASSSMRQSPTFLCGPPGIFTIGAVAAKSIGSKQEVDWYLELLSKVGRRGALVTIGDENETPYELLYGRAGYLWAALFVNNQLGYEAISPSILRPIVDAIITSGREKAHGTSCPLMYEWHGKPYWGAAHGLAGIMHCLMHFQLEQDDAEAVKGVLKYMIKNRFPGSKNYPSREASKDDRLVQWCHGAPGVALTLCKAAEVYQEEKVFKDAAVEAGEVVWKRGLLRKVGICHGISGNAYTFLALKRLTGEEVHLHRATAFGCFLLDRALDLIASGDLHGGDRPYSMFEGLAGMSCLFFDLAHPEKAKFPGYEI